MDKLELQIGKIYRIRHNGEFVKARFIGINHHDGWKSKHSTFQVRASNHFLFEKLLTGRTITLKSTVNIIRLDE